MCGITYGKYSGIAPRFITVCAMKYFPLVFDEAFMEGVESLAVLKNFD